MQTRAKWQLRQVDAVELDKLVELVAEAGRRGVLLNIEACEAMKAMGYPQDISHAYYVVEGRHDEKVSLKCRAGTVRQQFRQTYSCPSELEALDWLEDEQPDHWCYERDDSGLWFAQNGQRPTSKAYREIGRFRTPSELIVAIYQDWEVREKGTISLP